MTAPRPHILLVTTDQQRFDTTGPAAPSFLRTPHLDHLRREGIDYSAAYADCPVCVPSRVSIMTGKTVGAHGMAWNGASSQAMGRDDTLPACLRACGYQTAAIGKMHFTPQRARHGFDEMVLPDDYYRWLRHSGHATQPMRHGLGQNELYPGMATVPEALTLTSWIAEQCVEYIRERRDPTVPFFLWCSFSKPHPPLDPPEPYYSMYRDAPIPTPVHGDWSAEDRRPAVIGRFWQRHAYDLIPPEVIHAARAAYYGLVTQIDYNLGRILAALQDVSLLDDTLILFASDHGEYLGDHGGGSKVFFHEPSAHIPFIVRLPKNADDRRHGTTVAAPVTLADILPTLVTAAGARPPAACDGQDAIALARGELAGPRLYLDGMSGGINRATGVPDYLALTDGRWKYCWYPEGATEQLFDLAADPWELRNLACEPAFAPRREELREELERRQQARGAPWLDDGRLPARPLLEDAEVDRRNQGWPGYHTDYHGVDVRH